MISNNYNQLLDDNTEIHNIPSGLEGNKINKQILPNPSPLFPPPYSPPSTIHKTIDDERSEIDNVLYKKMLSLENMLSDIHSSVIDNSSSYKDISIQLSEINDSMKHFYEEASIRIRKEFSETKKLESIFSQISSNDDNSVCSTQSNHTKEVDKEDVCYDRVCTLVETLINDANSVLDSSSTPAFNSNNEESDTDSIISIPYNPKKSKKTFHPETLEPVNQKIKKIIAEREPEIKFFCQVSQGSNILKHQGITKRLILPLLKDAEDVDLERLALLSTSNVQEGNHQNLATLQISQSELARLLLDEDPSRLLISLIYWVVMFTLGSVLFDSSLCNTAGIQMLNVIKLFSKQRNYQRRRSLTIKGIEGPNVSTQPFSPQISSSTIISQRRRSI